MNRFSPLVFLLIALLLCASCAEDGQQTSVAESVGSEASVSSSPAVSEPSAETDSVDTVSLLTPQECAVYDGLVFTLSEGWELCDPAQEGELFSASAKDGSLRVNVFRSALVLNNGLTTELLLDETEKALPQAWETAGMQEIKTERGSLVFLENETPALTLSALSAGQEVYQKQLYIDLGDALLLVTVTSRVEDRTEELLQAFGRAAE